MNTDLILNLAKPYVIDDFITYDEFEAIYGQILTRREQYEVVEILFYNGIGLCDSHDEVEIQDEDDIKSLIEQQNEVDLQQINEHVNRQLINSSSVNDNVDVFSETGIHQTNETLCTLIQQGDKQAMTTLCEKNRLLIRKCVNAFLKKHPGGKISNSDLEQSGFMGLMKAAMDFRSSLGTAFTTYAVSWIQQSISKEFYNTGYTIRMPSYIYDAINKITHIEAELESKGIPYMDRIGIIADQLGVTEERVRYCIRLRSQFMKCVSLQTLVGEDGDSELGDFIPEEDGKDIESIVFSRIASEELHRLINLLPEKEATVVKLRFGLDGNENMTLEQVGKVFHVTRERIRQMEKKALKTLWLHLKRDRTVLDLIRQINN